MSDDIRFDLSGIFERIASQLREKGIDIDFSASGLDICAPGKGGKIKMVCISPDLKERVEKMGEANRKRVLMVRVDDETLQDLDSWVATGAVKSRSEAAALFIREGLRLRKSELDKLKDALNEVQQAQERLKERAAEVFQGRQESTAQGDGSPQGTEAQPEGGE